MIFRPWQIAAGVWLPTFQAAACPVCDFGGRDAASFILITFGLFITGFITLFVLFWRRGGLKLAGQGGSGSLLAEGIVSEEGQNEPKQ